MATDPAHLLQIHARLCAGDPTASADLIEAAYLPLAKFALARHPGLVRDVDEARDLALTVIAQLVRRPTQFDPSRGNLFGFMCMALAGDIRNRARAARTERKNFDNHAVEVRGVGGNSYETSPDMKIDAKRIMEKHLNKLVKEPGDREVLELYLGEERDTDAYAAALHLTHLPENEQTAEVKRRKDRIEVRLKRLRDKL